MQDLEGLLTLSVQLNFQPRLRLVLSVSSQVFEVQRSCDKEWSCPEAASSWRCHLFVWLEKLRREQPTAMLTQHEHVRNTAEASGYVQSIGGGL